jgi:PAS domain S-box-containing protein
LSRQWTKSRTRGSKLHLTKTKARISRQTRADLERQLKACKEEIANARERLIEVTKQQTATSEMLRIISDSPLQSVLDAVAEHAARLCDSNNAEIYRLENNLLRLAASYGEIPVHTQAHEGFPVNRDRVIGRAICDRRSVHVHDLAAEDSEYPLGSSDAKSQGHRTTLGTPLLRERTPIGVISFRRREVRPFSDNDIALLETFADEAVIAIENVRLFEAEKQRTLALSQANRNLQESEARFRDYAESASDWYWETDPDHKFVRVTDYERLRARGFAPVSRIGLARWEFATDVESEPEKWELHRSMLEARQPFRDFVYRDARSDGSLVYYKISGKPIYDAKGAFLGYRGTSTDVTAAMRAQKEHERLHQLESDLAHMNRVSMMGELAASLCHELTQPIASARSNACAAQNFLDMQPPDLGEAREALRYIVDDTNRAGDMIDRIRDHIKKAPSRKDRFDLNKAIDEVIVLGRNAIIKNGVSVQTRLSEDLFLIHGDRVQLQQVVLNLILNAVEAMGSSKAGARELLISTEQNHNGILVAVGDSGQGIDPPNLERVFDAFYTTKPSGMGMGLSICRSIVEAHEGRLWAEANEPRGTVFRFTLPAVDHEFSSGVHSPDMRAE